MKPLPLELFDQADKKSPLEKKRLFIGLTTATCAALCLGLLLLFLIPYVGLESIHPAAPYVYGFVLAALGALIFFAGFGLVAGIQGKRPPFSRRLRGITVKLFLPLMIMIGRIFGISKERVRSSFIKVNNEMVLLEHGTYPPEKLLLLMPHCLQKSDCRQRLTYDINNCKRCGKCPIDGLLELSKKYGIHLAIATGGTIARRIVVKTRPRLILAVACERDLAEGIQDTYPLPVYGVLNERPDGPCLNTLADLNHVESAIGRFLKQAQEPRDITHHDLPKTAGAEA
jgi:hypothetical protein